MTTLGRKPLHGYGGIEHSQPGPFSDCLLCRIEGLEAALREAEGRSEEQAEFIGTRQLGDAFTEWAIARHEELDRALVNPSEATREESA